MARKKDVEGQEMLVDNYTPEMKAAVKKCKEYENLVGKQAEERAEYRIAEKKKRQQVLESIQASGIKPDADGSYTLRVDEKEWVLTQESQLKIKKHKIKDDETFEELDEDE
jgi:hypothetical protein